MYQHAHSSVHQTHHAPRFAELVTEMIAFLRIQLTRGRQHREDCRDQQGAAGPPAGDAANGQRAGGLAHIENFICCQNFLNKPGKVSIGCHFPVTRAPAAGKVPHTFSNSPHFHTSLCEMPVVQVYRITFEPGKSATVAFEGERVFRRARATGYRTLGNAIGTWRRGLKGADFSLYEPIEYVWDSIGLFKCSRSHGSLIACILRKSLK